MTESERLRAHSERCLRLAKQSTAVGVAQTMYKLAADYLALAQSAEEAEASGQRQQRGNLPPPPSSDHAQQPALQQQQVQPKDDGDA
jgi:hypothetical protein